MSTIPYNCNHVFRQRRFVSLSFCVLQSHVREHCDVGHVWLSRGPWCYNSKKRKNVLRTILLSSSTMVWMGVRCYRSCFRGTVPFGYSTSFGSLGRNKQPSKSFVNPGCNECSPYLRCVLGWAILPGYVDVRPGTRHS